MKNNDMKALKSPLRILHLEDNAHDAELVRQKLADQGITPEITRVMKRETYVNALEQGQFDLILSDYSMPGFNGGIALVLAQEKCPQTPFIFVSGTLGVSAAVESLKRGASNCISKDRLDRLAPCIQEALQESDKRERAHHAEEALFERAELFQQISETGNDLVAVLDLDGVRLYTSPSYQTLFENEPLHGSDGFANIHPEDRERMRQLFNATVKSGIGQRADFRFLLQDGTDRYIESQGGVIRDKHGTVSGVIVVSRDVTRRKSAEQNLKASEERFRNVFQTANDAIILTDGRGNIAAWNAASQRMFGYSEEEVRGKPLTSVFPERYREGQQAGFGLTPAASASRFIAIAVELHGLRKDGNEFPLEFTLSTWKGEGTGAVVVFKDITEKKHLETQSLRAQRLESVGRLAGGIAHDLNNVLSPILMLAPLLGPKLHDPADKRMLELVEASARRGADMVRQILSFSRGVEGSEALVQIQPLIDEQVKLAKQTFPPSIKVRSNVAPDLRPVMGNPTRLFQVLMNLCVNARDAMPNGGSLLLEAENVLLDSEYVRVHPETKAGPHVVVRVRDTGTGIPPEIIEKMFKSFFTTKPHDRGTGLGLSTVLSIVNQCHGHVRVKSEVGQGTTFEIYLPSVEQKATQGSKTKIPDLPKGHGQWVLLVDDEETIRQITTATLENSGYQVLSACDGSQAVALYAEHEDRISLIIADMVMPFMDGATMIDALKRVNPAVKILAMSGQMDDRKLDHLIEKKEILFLPKPFSSEKLLTSVHQLLAKTTVAA